MERKKEDSVRQSHQESIAGRRTKATIGWSIIQVLKALSSLRQSSPSTLFGTCRQLAMICDQRLGPYTRCAIWGYYLGGQEGCGKWTLECAICVIAFASILELAKALPAILAVVDSKVNDHEIRGWNSGCFKGSQHW